MLSLIIPTYNERDGLETLIRSIGSALDTTHFGYEVIIVDDGSPDGTAEEAERLMSQGFPLSVVRRSGKLGLASAVIHGWSVAKGNILGVMDADGSHDAAALTPMMLLLERGDAEVTVGSRYVEHGAIEDWPWYRQFISRVAVALGSKICPVKDLTSGFLLFHREVIEGVTLDPIGFKIGLEVLVRGRYRKFVEVPYTFRDRLHGTSKFTAKQVVQYLQQLVGLYHFRFVAGGRREPIYSSPMPCVSQEYSEESVATSEELTSSRGLEG